MSLINQMLKDLEKRHAMRSSNSEQTLKNVSAVSLNNNSHKMFWINLLIACIFVTLAVGLLITKHHQHQLRKKIPSLPAIPIASQVTKNIQQNIPKQTNIESTLPPISFDFMPAITTTTKSTIPIPLIHVPLPTTQSNIPTPTTQTNHGSLNKTIVPLTPDQQADQQYQMALDLLEQNRVAEAMQLFQQLISQMPNYSPAREALAALLIKQGQNDMADQLLTAGLQLQPNYLPFIKLKARVLIDESQFDSALVLLEQAAPDINNMDQDYSALLADLYQRLNQPLKAAIVYHHLTDLQPDNGNWWMGLGMAFVKANKPRAALEAFQKALITGNLDTASQVYVNNQLHLLGD